MRWKQNDSPPAGGNRRRRLIAAAGLTAFVLAMAAICLMAGKPMLTLLSDPDRFRDWVDERGLWGRAAFVGMMSLQIIAAMIPGEPLEIAAGYAFGAAEGTALCLLGALLGGTAVFLGVRRFGRRAVEAFFPPEKIDALPLLRNGRRLEGWLFVVFLFPGTPKDLLTYCAGLTHMHFHHRGRRAGRGQLRLCRAGVWRDAPALRGGPCGIPPHERPGKGRKEACPVL